MLAFLKQRPNTFFQQTLWGERLSFYSSKPAWVDESILRETFSPEEIRLLSASFSQPENPAARAQGATNLRNIAKLKAAGARFVLGTDTGGVTGGQYFGLAKEILSDRPMGVGVNNWSYWVSKVYGPKTGAPYEDYDATPVELMEQSPEVYAANPNYAPPAHNVFVLTVGEMGWLGLFVFLLLWLRWFRMGEKFFWVKTDDPMYRMGTGFLFAICGIFLQSQTEWVYRQTTIMMTFYVILGALASLYYHKRHARKAALVQTEPLRAPTPSRVVVAT
jgi:hypothetical protein